MGKSLAQTLIQFLIKSFGLKRKVAALLQTVAAVASTVPILAPFALSIATIANWLGVAALIHAGGARLAGAKPVGGNILTTLAALLGALVIATKSVPQLQPYAEVIQQLATIVGIFATGANAQTLFE